MLTLALLALLSVPLVSATTFWTLALLDEDAARPSLPLDRARAG